MMTCKQVSRALNDDDYMTLSPFKRFLLRFHVGMCVVCGKYNRQVMQFQDGVRTFLSREDTSQTPPLDSETRGRLQRFMDGVLQGGK